MSETKWHAGKSCGTEFIRDESCLAIQTGDCIKKLKFNSPFFGTVSRRTPAGVVDIRRREAPYYKANINSNFYV
jgi:hypothetical protein